MDSYSLLINKLDQFIRKFYRNQLLRGGILFVGIFLVFYLLVTILEYFGNFNILTRTILFYTYLFINIVILVRLIILPLTKLFRIGKVLSHEEAAKIIGNHFPEVKDKLLNTLQLRGIQSQTNGASKELIEASIGQRIAEMKPVTFKKAVDFTQNRKYIKYALPPLIILLLIFVINSNVVTGPTTRLIKHSVYYEPVVPFRLDIQNESLEGTQQENFTLEVKVTGEELPVEVYLETDGLVYRLNRQSPTSFSYLFRNLQKDLPFYLLADQYRSPKYELRVLPKPIILSFETILDYPDYTLKEDETLENSGDLVIPAGTRVNWKFYTRDALSVSFTLNGEQHLLESPVSNTYEFGKQLLDNSMYSVVISNDHMKNNDSLFYSVSIIPDVFPNIMIESFQDSLNDKRLYFKGLIKDDYGFSRLTFNYANINEDQAPESDADMASLELPFERNTLQQPFFHFFNIDSTGLNPGDEITYYFEVWDNDRITGPKKARSRLMSYRAPTMEEIEEETKESNEQIREDMEDALEDLQLLQKEIDDLNKKLLQKEALGWQEKQQIEDLLQRQKSIEDKIKQIEEENLTKSRKEEQYKEIDEELLRKQQKLEELFKELMTDEMKELFEELQKLMDEMDKDKMNKMLEDMKYNNEDLEKDLDRTLELFKQLEFEKMLQDAIDKLDDIREKQEKLAEETETKEKSDEDLLKEQEELNEEFDKLREQMDDMHKKNEDLERPNNIDETDEMEEDIQEDMNESSDQLQQGKSKKASGSQQNASDKMKKMSDKMKQMQSDMYMDNLGEDINTLREILENLIQLSFDQESLITSLDEVTPLNPQYIDIIQDQNRIREDMKMVEDSLFALSKRQTMIEPFVVKEVEAINQNLEKALGFLEERHSQAAQGNQQFTMTSINNLALLLSEALDQMMSAMQMQGSGQCSKGNPKPGAGKPSSSAKSMRQLQEQLNQQLQQMKDGMQKGKGEKGETGQPTMSEQLARMAAQQAAIRRMMEGYQEDLKDQGKGNSRELNKLMNEMEQTETELVNKIITQQTLDRQKEILSRLLKHERAELEREKEERRESKEAKDEIYSNPNEFLEYKRIKSQEVELLRTVPPNLRPFYKNKVNEYFYNTEMK